VIERTVNGTFHNGFGKELQAFAPNFFVFFGSGDLLMMKPRVLRTGISRDERIKQIVRILQKRPWLRLQQLSEMADLSASRLQHLFKRETGRSIGSYSKEIQLIMTRNMLLHSRYPLKLIGQAVGIPDVANLGRYFKRRFGYTPASYRRRFRQHSFSDQK
jgi:transcriptional regulator GlxA family with amidase domain